MTFGWMIFLRGSVVSEHRVIISAALYLLTATLYALGICDASLSDGNGKPCTGESNALAGCRSIYGPVCFYALTIYQGLALVSLAAFLLR